MSTSDLNRDRELPPPENTALAPQDTVDPRAGVAAAAAAAATSFARYQREQQPRTLRRQEADLALFARYLGDAQAIPADAVVRMGARLFYDADAWANITWGLVDGFVQWQLQEGYTVGSINVRLATVRRYASLAQQAGVISHPELALIQTVRGFSSKRGRAANQHREQQRIGTKKAEAIVLTGEQIAQLKSSHDVTTPLGRRNRLICCLFLDLGLRVGEVAGLTIGTLRLDEGFITFYRQKVHMTQTHKLTADLIIAARAYTTTDLATTDPAAPLFRRSRKDGSLQEHGLSDRALRALVQGLGVQWLGLPNLAPHDLRHSWATRAQRGGTHPLALKVAGGWASLRMVERYAHANTIANDEVVLG